MYFNSYFIRVFIFILGTHWLSNIVNFLIRGQEVTKESTFAPTIVDISTQEVVDAVESPRVLSVHDIPECIPSDALTKIQKFILVFRNPKDTAVSMFHHFRRGMLDGGKLGLNWDSFIDNFMLGNSK